MRYRLRTLLIWMAIGPMVLAGMWICRQAWRAEQTRREYERIPWLPSTARSPIRPAP